MNSLTRRLIAGAIVLGLSLYARPVFADQVTLLSIQSGHSVVLRAEGLTRVAVGDGRIAGVVPVGTSQVVINGKSGGHTTVYIWAGGRREVYEVTVTEQQLDDLAQMLRSSISAPSVQVVSFGHNIVVRGTVSDGAQLQQIAEIISRFVGTLVYLNGKDDKAVIINAVTISQNLGDFQREIASIPGQAASESIPTAEATSSSAATRPMRSPRRLSSTGLADSPAPIWRATGSSSTVSTR